MHESSLGKQILAAVLDKAGARRVREIHGWIAETEHLDPKSISFHFEAQAKGTLAEGARLHLELRWVEARCEGCAKTYKPDHHVLLCPHCGSTDAELLGETGLGVTTIEVDDG